MKLFPKTLLFLAIINCFQTQVASAGKKIFIKAPWSRDFSSDAMYFFDNDSLVRSEFRGYRNTIALTDEVIYPDEFYSFQIIGPEWKICDKNFSFGLLCDDSFYYKNFSGRQSTIGTTPGSFGLYIKKWVVGWNHEMINYHLGSKSNRSVKNRWELRSPVKFNDIFNMIVTAGTVGRYFISVYKNGALFFRDLLPKKISMALSACYYNSFGVEY